MVYIGDKKTEISSFEEQELATTMQILLMNEIFADKNWRPPHAVFHGGTALALLHDNGRWSEDLDLMVDNKLFETLEKTMNAAAERLQLLTAKTWPECKIDLNGPKGSDEVQAWYFGWTHPRKHGKVKVKMEFLPRPSELLQSYKTVKLVPVGASVLPVSITSIFHGPELISSWADKVIAMSQRPHFKWRDVYDMWFLDTRMKGLASAKNAAVRVQYPEDATFVAALESTAAIYGKSLDVVKSGLEALLEKDIFADAEKYKKDIAKWLPEEVVDNDDLLDNHREIARREIERAVEIIKNHEYSGPSL